MTFLSTDASSTSLNNEHDTNIATLGSLYGDLANAADAHRLSVIVCRFDSITGQAFPIALEHVALLFPAAANETIGMRLYQIAPNWFVFVASGHEHAETMQIARIIRQNTRQMSELSIRIAVGSHADGAVQAAMLLGLCEATLVYGRRNCIIGIDISTKLAPAAARLAELLIARNTALLDVHTQLRETTKQALHDHVTQLPNVRSLMQTLPRYLERCAHRNTPLTLLLIDGDNLKDYNTRYGFSAGDEWIRGIAQILGENLRPGDFVARWMTGDEFIVLLPDTPRKAAALIAERLRQTVQQATTLTYTGTISIGVVHVSSTIDSETLLARAHDALMAAKGRGKNQMMLLDL